MFRDLDSASLIKLQTQRISSCSFTRELKQVGQEVGAVNSVNSLTAPLLCMCHVPVGPRPAREATDSGAVIGDTFRAKNKDNVNILRFLAENLEKEQVSGCILSGSCNFHV